MAEAERHHLGNNLDILQIFVEAQHRWLRTAEICEILRNYNKFNIAPGPPHLPPSGSLFLFDRKALRNFRKDGYNWRKKKDGKTVKEAHERLRFGSIDVLQCYYAHGEENEYFQRRSYWMLEEELCHIVLVHYREVKGNRTNFNHIKQHEDDTLNPQEIEVASPHSEMDASVSSNFLHDSNQVPAQTTDTASMTSAQASESDDAESVNNHICRASSYIKELGDVDASPLHSSSEAYWDTVESENVIDGPKVPSQVHSDTYLLGPSLSLDQLFSIIDFSPNWAYVGSEVKVLISGRFLKSREEAENCKWSCMFGEVEVRAEVIADGVIRCQAPLNKAGMVPFYVSCSDRVACSEVLEFEYRLNHIQDVNVNDNYSSSSSVDLYMRFGKLLSLSSAPLPGYNNSNIDQISQLTNTISSFLKEDTDEWDQMLKLNSEAGFSLQKVKEELLQKLLKDRLHVWLLQKTAEGGKGPSVLDEGGQGVLHFAAALGYDWALERTIMAGVSVDFRDVNGWTALHWAASCGSMRSIASLMLLGAASGALTDPTPKYPTGRTPADLASANGHKGIASYLAESALSAHLSFLNLDNQNSNKAEITNVSNEHLPCGQSLKDSLAALYNATQTAARIHQVFRVQSFKRKQLKEFGDDKFGMSHERALSFIGDKEQKQGQNDETVQAAAIRIQNKFRGWKGRKEFLIIRQQAVKIQAHVRGHQVRKNYIKIVWSVRMVEKAILGWRLKRRGFKSEAVIEDPSKKDTMSKEEDADFLKEGREQTEARLQIALASRPRQGPVSIWNQPGTGPTQNWSKPAWDQEEASSGLNQYLLILSNF